MIKYFKCKLIEYLSFLWSALCIITLGLTVYLTENLVTAQDNFWNFWLKSEILNLNHDGGVFILRKKKSEVNTDIQLLQLSITCYKNKPNNIIWMCMMQ